MVLYWVKEVMPWQEPERGNEGNPTETKLTLSPYKEGTRGLILLIMEIETYPKKEEK